MPSPHGLHKSCAGDRMTHSMQFNNRRGSSRSNEQCFHVWKSCTTKLFKNSVESPVTFANWTMQPWVRATRNPVHSLQENSSSCFNLIQAFQMMKNENSSPTWLPTPSSQTLLNYNIFSVHEKLTLNQAGVGGEGNQPHPILCFYNPTLFCPRF